MKNFVGYGYISTNKINVSYCIFYNQTDGFQYIISANQKEVDSIKEVFTEQEYEQYIENKIIEDLMDESDEEKFLGITVDLNYEK